MINSYPYVLANSKLASVFTAIENAARPPKFTHEFLKKIGFGSSNDRAFVTLFRHLGLIDENNAPTHLYNEIRDPQQRATALGEAIRQSYADLFAINTNIHKASDADIKSAISRTTGKDADYVTRAYSTFKALLSLAKFDGGKVRPAEAQRTAQDGTPVESESANGKLPSEGRAPELPSVKSGNLSLNYNIQIHLPATTDISVYNAIFRSLRDTLGIA